MGAPWALCVNVEEGKPPPVESIQVECSQCSAPLWMSRTLRNRLAGTDHNIICQECLTKHPKKVVLGACPYCGDLLPITPSPRLLAGYVKCDRHREPRYYVPLYKVKVK